MRKQILCEEAGHVTGSMYEEGGTTEVERPQLTTGRPLLTLSDGSEHQDGRLLHLPLVVEERLLEDRQQRGQQLVVEHVGEHVEGRRRTLACQHTHTATGQDTTHVG